MPKSKKRKTILLIRPAFQQRAALFTGVLAVSGIFIGVGILLLLPLLINAFSRKRMLVSRNILDTLMTSFPYLAFGAALIFILAVFIGIYYSHRVAGPVYHIERVLHARLQGERTKRITLRPKDHLQGPAELLNQYFEREDAVWDADQKLRLLLEDILGRPPAEGPKALMIQENEHRELLDCIRTIKEIQGPSQEA